MWDESFNLNSFTKKRFNDILPFLKKYCDKQDSPIWQERLNYYRTFSNTNASIKYLDMKIKKVVGVVETGLFINMANSVIIGNDDGSFKLIEQKG